MEPTGNVTTIQNGQTIINIKNLDNANFNLRQDNKPFNEYLTKELINAIKPYSKPAMRFMELVKDKPDWNQRASISDQAKDILAFSFVGVLGIQLQNLMAIGKESFSDSKQRNYIDNCISTAKKTLQILCFALLSDLWNHKKEKNIALSGENTAILTHFFEDWMEMGVKDYEALLKNLYQLFKDHELEMTLSELKEFGGHLLPESKFSVACNKLYEISETADTEKYIPDNCGEAEKQLTDMLTAVGFLASYKMVSIKSIGYEEIRNSTPKYLHNYVALGFDSKININTERLNYIDTPVYTDSILLFKGNYLNSINLFPFIIDMNTLTLEGGVKICFYSSIDMDEKSISFRFLEDNSIESISFSETMKPGALMNELLEDKEKHKKLKLDSVYIQFAEAKKAILGLSDVNDN